MSLWVLAAAVILSPEHICWVEAGWWTTDEHCICVPRQDNSMLSAGLLAELKDANRQRTSLSVTTLCVDVAVCEEACLEERKKKVLEDKHPLLWKSIPTMTHIHILKAVCSISPISCRCIFITNTTSYFYLPCFYMKKSGFMCILYS